MLLGLIFVDSGSAARTLDLDGPWQDGEVVYIKANNAQTHNVTIRRSGSAFIDGDLTEVVLESDRAAVTLIRNGTDWFIF